MTFNSDIHHRRSIRLKGYDYLQAGAYFVTICTQNRECLFGGITDGQMALNNAGRMVQMVWDKIPEHYAGIKTDAFVVMPNHIHGIIVLVGAGPRACPDTKPTGVGQSQKGQPRGGCPYGYGTITVYRATTGGCPYGYGTITVYRATTGGCPYGYGTTTFYGATTGGCPYIVVTGCGSPF